MNNECLGKPRECDEHFLGFFKVQFSVMLHSLALVITETKD